VRREIEFLRALDVGILSERRSLQPYGMGGGQPGARGQNLMLLASGRTVNLGGKGTYKCQTGDRILILTPGGGGYGAPAEDGERETPKEPQRSETPTVKSSGSVALRTSAQTTN
jgi:5-oxoprolinase (ATP-hydrolysing)